MLNLDTHILLRALCGDVNARERHLLASEAWGISGIVLWEIAKLHQLGRISLGLDDPDLARILAGLPIWPLDVPVCRATADLDFKGDPADEIIAATSVVHGVPLLTRDRRILASRRVPLAR